MEKNQTGRPKAVCEKIFRAINLGPAFSTLRRISTRHQTPSSPAAKYVRNPPFPNSEPSVRPLDIKTKLTSPQRRTEVPIKFEYTTGLTDLPRGKPKPMAMAMALAQNGSNNEQLLKTPKPSTTAKNAKPLAKDHQFSDYINKTKRKIRTTPSIKDRSESFFK